MVAGGVVEARLVFAERDRALVVTPGDLIFVDADDSPCRKTDEQVTPRAQEDAVEVDLRFVCPAGAEVIVLQAGFLAQDGTHRHLAHVTVPGAGAGAPRELDVVLAAGHERFQVTTGADDTEEASSGFARFFDLLRTGAVHVLAGPDHLAFLLALALESASFLELVQVATAFTIAHSVTLALAATGIARPPSSWIEPLVALSIAAVALRSVLATRRGAPVPARFRSGWPLAFLFGLVHGFAFAGALRTLGLHGLPLGRNVVGFNLGVEGGQLVALAIFVPVLAGLARLAGERRRVVRAIGTLLTVLGVVWFLARLVACTRR